MTSSKKPTSTRKSTSVSLADVAQKAGVSKMTASRVLRNTSGYSAETRELVLRIANEMSYVPNRLAAAFGSDTANNLVGICVPTLSRELYGQILEGMENKFASVNYQPIIGVVGYDDDVELAWLNSALSWRPSGLVVAGRERSSANRTFLQSLTIPCVEIWNLAGGTDTMQKSDPVRVGFDHFEAGAQMGKYLASRYKGPFGYVGVRDKHVKLGADRLSGFESALADAGVSAPRKKGKDNSLMATTFLNDKSSFYAGYYGTEQILTANPDLRALYYLDDNMAVGGMMLCQQKGLKIPGDIAIAGFGGMDIGAILPTRLTTTTAFRLRIGKTAAEVLLKKISGSPVSVLNDVGSELIRGETA